ncbi:glycoside hydrolase family 17 protein [Amorphotheca resinae ATCC 22711]|jgi:glucan endo-1,3-beta-D-glucosidase|uniref:Probable glucan endo-1,3-beta-glucosidase eglC n=1 Tax=Amorphotheca resinae ATCC 22711 TaxID=857342 RepID=A0A2T3AY89_AMORE|nr:glycoside hydrolase family 17 protein [Amorphotheca resinae ATCC 22711]PSS15010.1 glycoside hydrolase family 17 protein [Amorphotheca resinae ATCC 22711]
MKSFSYALALTAMLTGANASWKGFNNQATLSNGACKAQSDWENDFNKLKSLPGGYSAMRVYAASDCNTLANAVPAAVATGGKILVGIWTEDSNHYNTEKQALLSAVQKYGFDWVAAVSVGSEDLYRGDTTASALAQQVNDVRGMLSTVNGYNNSVKVGHVDTWTAWTNGQSTDVIKACDFIGTDGYPYYQTVNANSIDNASNLFWQSVQAVNDTVHSAGSNAPVWITETGWPTSGSTENQAVPSVPNAQRYWSEVACSAFGKVDTFWYSLQDYNANPSFGVLDSNGNPIYNLTC